jgi:hypothetical protein
VAVFQVSNWLGAVSAINNNVVIKSAVPVLPIYLNGPRFQSVFTFQPIIVQASTIASFADSCFNASSISSFAVSFSWAQLLQLPPNITSLGGIPISPSSVAQHALDSAVLAKFSGNFFLPPFALPPVGIFIFQVDLRASITTTGGAVSVQSTAYMAISVTPSLLLARITGSDRNIFVSPTAPNLVLDASGSFDPDIPTGASSGLSFNWTCVRLVSMLPCFSADDWVSIGSGSVLHIPSVLFAPSFNDSFVFQVTVSRGIRRSTSNLVRVTGISLALPIISVVVNVPTQGSSWVRITPQDSVQLLATLTPILSTPVGYTSTWISYSIPSIRSTPSVALLNINSGTLPGGNTYVFGFVVRSTVDPSVASAYNVSLVVDSPPARGSCSVLPISGEAMNDVFDVLCRDWVSAVDSLPLTYSVAVYTSDRSRSSLILQGFQLSALSQLYLPVGVNAQGNPSPTLQLGVSIRNRWGSTTTTYLTVNVSNPDLSSLAAVSALSNTALSALQLAQQTGAVICSFFTQRCMYIKLTC